MTDEKDIQDGYDTAFSKREQYVIQSVADCARLEIELAEARAELDRTTTARDILKSGLTNAHAKLADANAELTEARDELRARDEAIADLDQRARWRLAQTPYIGIGEGIAERLAEALSPNLTDWTLSHDARVELERTIDTDQIIEVTFEDSDQ